MTAIGFNEPLYILPFDHRGSFQTKMFGWTGTLSPEQTAEIASTKQVIYDGFKAALHAGVPEQKAGILVDEQFGGAILRRAVRKNSISSTVRNSPSTSRLSSQLSARCSCAITLKVIAL